MSDLLQRIDAIDHKAADWLAVLAASADEMRADDGKNWRGGLMGAFSQYDINDAERHLLCLAAFGHESSKDLTPGQCKALVYWLNDGGDALVAQICAAVLKAQGQGELPGMDPVEAAAQELGAIVRDDNIMKGESEMAENAEALFSASIKMYDPSGADVMITIRDGLVPGDTAAAKAESCAKLVSYLAGKGWRPNGNGRHQASAAHPANIEPAPPQPAAPAAQAPQAGGGNEVGALTFPAETLVANVHNGKTYWKVQGGQFSKYGVTIWPEVMAAAGLDPDQLDAMQTYDLTGRTATYCVTEEGNPQKVTALS